jgi:histidine ammonia-lyase
VVGCRGDARYSTPPLAHSLRETARVLTIGSDPVGVDELLAAARGEIEVRLDPSPAFRARIDGAARTLEAELHAGRAVYGVTTGVGASVENEISAPHRAEMPYHLMRFHGCGTGPFLDETEAAAVVAIRLVCLAKGRSGVRLSLLERLCQLLNRRLLPRIPERGSVGASGDLTPLSYLVAALVGEREVSWRGRVLPAAEALEQAGLEPFALAPKESLALMNGTTVMSALACLAVERAERLARLAAALTAVASHVTRGNPGHFDERIFAWKPHPGPTRVAAWIRADLAAAALPGAAEEPARLQDRYSIRCAPHVIGVLVEAAEAARRTLSIEVNGVDDNPLIDAERGDVLHGGNFYGGHVGFAMDGLKSAVASVADLLDRQLCLLCVPETSGGLPANLVAGSGAEALVHHGFKAMQIATSALAAEALKLTVPATAFSRSTESHNQDKVSMGTIAARDCRQVLELTETVAAIVLLACCQAVDLRGDAARSQRARALRDAVRKAVPTVVEDRRQDLDIEAVLGLYRSGELPIGELSAG